AHSKTSLAEFGGWNGRLTALIEAASTPGRWALLIREPLPRWTWGPVTLLGDAAHPMLPVLGAGAAPRERTGDPAPGAAPLRVRAHRPRQPGPAGQSRPRGLQPPARRTGAARQGRGAAWRRPL